MSHLPSEPGHRVQKFEDEGSLPSATAARSDDATDAAGVDSPGPSAVRGSGQTGAGRRRLPRLPRQSWAERLNGHDAFRVPYRLLNRIERDRFAGTYREQLEAPGTFLARRGHRLWMMRVNPNVTSHSSAHHNLDIVLALCAGNGIRYFAMEEPSSQTPRIAVPAAEWGVFVNAARRAGASSPLYVSLEGLDRRGRVNKWSTPVADPAFGDELAGQSRLGFFEILTPHDESTSFYGRGQACVVEKWEADEADTWHSPTINERTRQLASAHRSPATVEYGRRQLSTFAPFKTPHLFDVRFEIDLVYLWVDGSDPLWVARKKKSLEESTGVIQPEAASSERFRDMGELRYSLRSVHEYVPWARKIYLVTDRQIPQWLNTDHPQLQIVDHRQLFGDEGLLPTFNSHAIGARLHHIPGLSSHYLYMNDDVIFGRPVSPGLFFHGNGTSKFFLSKATLPYSAPGESSPHEQARRKVVQLLEQDFGVTATQTFFHTPIPQRRAIMDRLEAQYPQIFHANWSSQFRSAEDYEVNSWLHNYYGYLQGMAMPASIRYDYFDLSDPSIVSRMERLLRIRDKDSFCVNDSAEALQDNQEFVTEWLDRYLPRPSPYEK